MAALAQSLGTVDRWLRADSQRLGQWIVRREGRVAWACLGLIVAGAGVYGAVVGSWRSSWQAFYTGIKLPLAILLTTAGNGLLNGMLAPLLGLNLSFRRSLLLVLLSFAITSLLLGALAPAAWFLVWNTPPLTAATHLWSTEYGLLQLSLALFVAGAGTVGNWRLFPLLAAETPSRAAARNVLFAWLAGNLFLGSQICWVLRPFIWDPAGPETFIGRQYFHGSFFETVFDAARRLLFP